MIVTLKNELDEIEKRCQRVIEERQNMAGVWVDRFAGYSEGSRRVHRGVGWGEQSCEVGNVNISQPCPYGGAKLPFLGYHRVALLSVRVQAAPQGCR